MPDYSWLLKQLQDESAGASPASPEVATAPTQATQAAALDALPPKPPAAPLPVARDIVEPTPAAVAALPAPKVAAPAPTFAPLADSPAPVDVTPPAPTPAPPANPRDYLKSKLASMADKYGLESLQDFAPTPIPDNIAAGRSDRRLGLDLARAGDTIGAAFGGVKSNPQPFNDMAAADSADATSFDKDVNNYDNFKRQLALKASSDRAAKAGKFDPELADPNSAGYKTLRAALASTPEGRRAVESFESNARAAGVTPDLNRFDLKVGQGLSASTAVGNNERNSTRTVAENEKSRDFQRQMNEVSFGEALTKEAVGEEMKIAKELRGAEHPQRDVVNNKAPPTEEMAKKTRINDANTEFLVASTKKLINVIRNTPNLDRVNPLANGAIKSLQQDLLDQVRVVHEFGVPSGKDMEQLAREVADPTTFGSLIDSIVNGNEDGNQSVQKLKMLAEQAIAKSEAFAKAAGYGPYGQKSAAAPASPEEIGRNALGKNRVGSPAVKPPARAPGTSPETAVQVPDNAEIQVINENGDPGSIPANKVQAWLARNPKRKAVQ